MRIPTAADASPALGGWDYGDSVYGLEPLILPEPGVPGASADEAEEPARLLAELHRQHRSAIPPATAEDLERLFWFRWITGHHISFILWQLLATSMARSTRNGQAEQLSRWVRGYSAALLYTSSCTREIYNSLIRPSMYRMHPGFSGTWAPDYVPVRGLFRRRWLPSAGAEERDQLLREVVLSNQIHLGIASRLVPNGRSLLQEVAAAGLAGRRPRVWSALYDCYFITLRAPVPAQHVLTQLLRRCRAVAVDLAANGLYPAPAQYPEEFPDELRSASARALERELVDIVLDVADSAAAQTGVPQTGAQ